jgi:hypothetical protein
MSSSETAAAPGGGATGESASIFSLSLDVLDQTIVSSDEEEEEEEVVVDTGEADAAAAAAAAAPAAASASATEAEVEPAEEEAPSFIPEPALLDLDGVFRAILSWPVAVQYNLEGYTM